LRGSAGFTPASLSSPSGKDARPEYQNAKDLKSQLKQRATNLYGGESRVNPGFVVGIWLSVELWASLRSLRSKTLAAKGLMAKIAKTAPKIKMEP
jgi:hypothetical protein